MNGLGKILTLGLAKKRAWQLCAPGREKQIRGRLLRQKLRLRNREH